MLSPKRTKFRKQQRGRMRGVATRGNKISFGQFALQAQDCGWSPQGKLRQVDEL